jgi:hypothetical protein
MLTLLLTVLPLLLCPLLMLACMLMMRNRETPERQARDRHQDPPMAARVAQLERELAELRGHLPEAGAAAEEARRHGPTPARFIRRHTGATGLTGRR